MGTSFHSGSSDILVIRLKLNMQGQLNKRAIASMRGMFKRDRLQSSTWTVTQKVCGGQAGHDRQTLTIVSTIFGWVWSRAAYPEAPDPSQGNDVSSP
jgi:hypothetical protein